MIVLAFYFLSLERRYMNQGNEVQNKIILDIEDENTYTLN